MTSVCAERRVARRTADAVVGDDVELGRVDVGRLAEDEGERKRDDQHLDGLLEQQAEEEAGEDGDEERLALVVAEREGVEDDEECGGEGGEHGKAPCHNADPPRQRAHVRAEVRLDGRAELRLRVVVGRGRDQLTRRHEHVVGQTIVVPLGRRRRRRAWRHQRARLFTPHSSQLTYRPFLLRSLFTL